MRPWKNFRPVRKEGCIGCKTCLIICPEGAVREDGDGNVFFDYEICNGCGLCAKHCPVEGIKMEEIPRD